MPRDPKKTAVGPRIRNASLRRVRVADLADAPWNHRTHPQAQQEALDGAIDELGFYGYPDVFEAGDGTLMLIDGHLRKGRLIAKYGVCAEIDVNVTDFDEAEAKKANLTKDPLAALAEINAERSRFGRAAVERRRHLSFFLIRNIKQPKPTVNRKRFNRSCLVQQPRKIIWRSPKASRLAIVAGERPAADDIHHANSYAQRQSVVCVAVLSGHYQQGAAMRCASRANLDRLFSRGDERGPRLPNN